MVRLAKTSRLNMSNSVAVAFWRCGAAVVLLASLLACDNAGQYRLMQGETMGTYYRIQYAHNSACQPSQFAVEQLLGSFNQSLSTYIADSEVSQVNQTPAGQAVSLSKRFEVALRAASELWQDSGGAFDVTVGPLVNLWGFGPTTPVQWPPTEDQQNAAAAAVGMQQLTLREDGTLRKQLSDTYIDFSSIAKGQAVDEVSETLLAGGCEHFLVDIGGEVRGSGVNVQQRPWRVGIEVPNSERVGAVQRVLSVADISVATSGDYRNFRQFNGQRVDHVIDPRTGKPADNAVVAVSVMHPSAMWADAYATTLMVLGTEQGLAFAEQHKLAALILTKSASGEVVERYTAALKKYLLTQAE